MEAPRGWHETALPVDPDIQELTKYLANGDKKDKAPVIPKKDYLLIVSTPFLFLFSSSRS